jgi:hypothetical protein
MQLLDRTAANAQPGNSICTKPAEQQYRVSFHYPINLLSTKNFCLALIHIFQYKIKA